MKHYKILGMYTNNEAKLEKLLNDLGGQGYEFKGVWNGCVIMEKDIVKKYWQNETLDEVLNVED